MSHAHGTDDSQAVFAQVYDELRRMADQCIRGQPVDRTLEPTALVHEAYLRLAGKADAFNDRSHFVAVAVTAMRQILVDHARRRAADKRGGGWSPTAMTSGSWP